MRKLKSFEHRKRTLSRVLFFSVYLMMKKERNIRPDEPARSLAICPRANKQSRKRGMFAQSRTLQPQNLPAGKQVARKERNVCPDEPARSLAICPRANKQSRKRGMFAQSRTLQPQNLPAGKQVARKERNVCPDESARSLATCPRKLGADRKPLFFRKEPEHFSQKIASRTLVT